MDTFLNNNKINLNMNTYTVGTVMHIKNRNKYDAIKELIHNSPDLRYIRNKQKLEQAVIESEKNQCTGFGRGVAIAHGKTDLVNEIVILLGISNKGIQYNSIDGKPVNIMFIIASPPDKPSEYIHALSAVAKMLSDECFKKDILSARCIKNIKRKVSSTFRSMLLH